MQIIHSKLLKQFKNLTQGFTTKQNGNLGFHVGDDRESVIQNHKALGKELSYNYETLVHMQQIHSNECRVVETYDDFFHPPCCDALITNKKNIPLMVMVADCSPLLFYDAKQEVIALAHAGRAGTFSNIVQSVLTSFKENYNSSVENIFVSVGASIKECCYEVGEEIVQEAEELSLSYSISKRENSYYLNISKILSRQLLNAGILEQNIEFIDECSCCNQKSYYSYRGEGKTGRFTGIVMLK